MKSGPISKGTYALILLTPLVFPGFFPFDVNLILAVSACLLFISFLLLSEKQLYIPKTFMLGFAVALILQLWLVINNGMPALEAWKLQLLMYIVAAGMLIAGMTVSSRSLPVWMKIYIAIATLWSVIALFVWLGATDSKPLEIAGVTVALAPALKLAGPFNQGNIFATAIGFAWIFCHWLFLRYGNPLFAVGALFFTAILFDTLSKGGWLAFGITLLLLLFATKPTLVHIVRTLLPIWLFGGALGVVFLEFSQPATPSDAFLSVVQSSASMHFRMLIWASSIAEFLSSPWSGVGWGQFADNFWSASINAQDWLHSHVGWNDSLYNNAISAHNILLHALAEGGLFVALLLVWGIWRILIANGALIANGNSMRLPFALVALAFVLQSQLNISYTQPIPLLMAAFFSGIALAPWLRKSSWVVNLQPAVKTAGIIVAICSVFWAGLQTSQWFSAEQAVRDFDMNNENSVRSLAEVATEPRKGAIPLIWLGYNIATTHQHPGLLTWMLPYLKQSIHELPYIDAYQVYFYALAYSQRLDEACELGRVIKRRNIPHEKNSPAYEAACRRESIGRYEFGLKPEAKSEAASEARHPTVQAD